MRLNGEKNLDMYEAPLFDGRFTITNKANHKYIHRERKPADQNPPRPRTAFRSVRSPAMCLAMPRSKESFVNYIQATFGMDISPEATEETFTRILKTVI